MQGVLGEKIGEGVFADVHAWAPGQVLKLLKPGVPRRFGVHEARMTRAVFAAGAPAPEVFDEVTMEGRFGLVLTRLDGPTLLRLSQTGAMASAQVGALHARVCFSVHTIPAPPDVLSLRDWMDASLRFSAGKLSEPIAAGILPLIERLPPSDGLCHGDLHGANVIVTADGPRLIDWSNAVSAPAALDLAGIHVLLSELAPQIVPDPERPRAVNGAVQSEYAQLAGLSPAALTAAIEPYLPIARVFALLGGAFPAQRTRLIQQVEAALRAQD